MKPVELEDTVLTEFFVAGWPYAKQSFRYRNNGHHFQKQNLADWEEKIGWTAKSNFWGDPVTYSVRVYLHFFVRRNTADIDNLVKAALDGLQGVIFKNDKQVMELHASKQITRQDLGVRIKICTMK